jgi:3-phosphoshikimate 1-carboxyvinyltransferase
MSSRNLTLTGADALVGEVSLPADKSIAHRSALISAISEGTSRIVGYPDSADPQSTLSCLRALGVEVGSEPEGLVVHGRGLRGLRAPKAALDCGNSGTTMRLLAGILAGQPFGSQLFGDASLSKRPMQRVIDPLRLMGANLTSIDGRPPLDIAASQGLTGIRYPLPVASAQVKSCVLLAGLYAQGETTVVESRATRDHTERMLGLSRVRLGEETVISVRGGTTLPARVWSIPADFSAAAFFLVAGSVLDGSLIRMPRVGLNPTRTGLMDVLRAMGADIRIENERDFGGEPIGDVVVKSAPLSGVRIDGDMIPNLIDEIPVLCVAATAAEGVTEIRDAEELRHKESDRIAAVAAGLRSMGAQVEEYPDGLAIEGGHPLKGARIPTHHDHRIAMAFAIAAQMAQGETMIEDADVASVSFPTFYETLERLR